MKRAGGTVLDFKVRESVGLASSLLPYLVFLPLYLLTLAANLSKSGALGETAGKASI